MTNYAHGHNAEKIAADYLQRHGYKIIALNWKDRQAEIDIIAHKQGQPLLFVEVKYRESTTQGGGLDYITSSKLSQMAFAANLYVAKTQYHGEYTLGALEVSGNDYRVTDFVDSITI